MRVRRTGANILGLKLGIVLQNCLGVHPWLNRLSTSSTEMRMSRTMGLPPKMSGRAVIRDSSLEFFIVALRTEGMAPCGVS